MEFVDGIAQVISSIKKHTNLYELKIVTLLVNPIVIALNSTQIFALT